MTRRSAALVVGFSLLAVAGVVTPSPAGARTVGHRPSPAGARTVGHGTPRSCTSAAVVAAVRAGGTIGFSCGPRPVTIRMRRTAKVVNTSSRVVLDGGGRVTLSGVGQRRILYMDTCDRRQRWTTSHCQDQATPRLVVRDLTFAHGNATGQTFDGGGGGAIFARGGRLRVERSTFVANRCERSGPDIGGGAVRVLSQYHGLPAEIIASRFRANVCSNGGALSSIGVSWDVRDSEFVANRAIGSGANPARTGQPGGGSGGAIYNDGNRFRLVVTRSRMTGNSAREGGGAIFFVSNDRTGTLTITASSLRRNPSRGFETRGLPGIFFQGAGSPRLNRSALR